MLRGEFALLSTENLDGKYQVLSDQKVTGKACYDMLKASIYIGEGVFDLAVEEALADQSPGTILVDAEFIDDGSCVLVIGFPARLIAN